MTSVKSKSAKTRRSSSASRKKTEYPWLKVYPKQVDWNAELTPKPLGDVLDEAVGKYGARNCTHFLGKSLTYDEIGALSNRLACGLQQLGVKKGVHVGLLLPNTPTYVAFYFAILKVGGTVVNYNPLYTAEELEGQVKDSKTKIMVTLDLKMLFDKVDTLLAKGVLEKAIVATFADLLPTIKSLLFRTFKSKELAKPAASSQADRIVFERDLVANDGRYDKVDIKPLTDIAVLQYTGGTTGTPKGAMLSHSNLTINVQQIQGWSTILEPGAERVYGDPALLPRLSQ